MYIAFTIIIVILAILLVLLVLVQNSKGGGLASGFASGNQVLGAPKTTDVLEKASWTLAGLIVALSIFAAGFNKAQRATSADESAIVEQVQHAAEALDAAELPAAPAEETAE